MAKKTSKKRKFTKFTKAQQKELDNVTKRIDQHYDEDALARGVGTHMAQVL